MALFSHSKKTWRGYRREKKLGREKEHAKNGAAMQSGVKDNKKILARAHNLGQSEFPLNSHLQ